MVGSPARSAREPPRAGGARPKIHHGQICVLNAILYIWSMEKFPYGGRRKQVKADLIREFGSVKKASESLEISYHNLSRILNGKAHELKTHIKILIAIGELPDSRYIFPKEDLRTFEIINKLR